jgi:hypothetical protein
MGPDATWYPLFGSVAGAGNWIGLAFTSDCHSARQPLVAAGRCNPATVAG